MEQLVQIRSSSEIVWAGSQTYRRRSPSKSRFAVLDVVVCTTMVPIFSCIGCSPSVRAWPELEVETVAASRRTLEAQENAGIKGGHTE